MKQLRKVFSSSIFKCLIYEDAKIVAAGRVLADGADYSYICDVTPLLSQISKASGQVPGGGIAVAQEIRPLRPRLRKTLAPSPPFFWSTSMGQRFSELSEKYMTFIAEQKLFFVGTATADSRVNISPKGMDSFRVINNKRVVWLNVTGSVNETAAHVQLSPRMTIMFCAFAGAPLILRLYGSAKVIHKDSPEWCELETLLPSLPGARQRFDLDVDLVQTSCGMAVPYFNYESDRELLKDWAVKKGDDGIKEYWGQKNQFSLDGTPTHIISQDG